MFENPVLIVIILLVAAISAALGFMLGRARSQSGSQEMHPGRISELQREIEQSRQLVNEAQLQATQYRTQVEGLNQQLNFVTSQLSQVQQNEKMRTEREREREQHEQAKTLEEQSKVLQALAPVQRNLDMLQHKVEQIEEGRKREMGALDEQLKGLSDQQSRLDRQTSSLSAALRNNKVRGAWGEAQLRNIVESAGLTEHIDFDTQIVVTDEQGHQQRPDMIVHLPGGKTIPIDAKAPYADYQRACEIPDSASEAELHRRNELLAAHAKALREHVRALGEKAYWKSFDTAPDFVIAFIPNEALLQAALEADPTLLDDAFARKVALTSPVTLWAVLKSVAYAWQQQALTDDAKALFDVSREIYERFAILGERATALGQQIGKTVSAYNSFASSLETRLLVSARRLQRIDSSKIIKPVEMLDSEHNDVRDLTAPELTSDE